MVMLFQNLFVSLHRLVGTSMVNGLGAYYFLQVNLQQMSCLRPHRSSRWRLFLFIKTKPLLQPKTFLDLIVQLIIRCLLLLAII